MDNQLVTVAVTTYNSVDFVIETLNSIVNQNYENIELVISDDFSEDGTIEVVEDWLSNETVKRRFSRVKFLKVKENTGISANCNRCIRESSADWIKFIAGDDILLPNCIESNMDFVRQNPDAEVVFSAIKMFEQTFDETHYIKTTPSEYPFNLMNPSFTAGDQWRILLESDRIHYTPSYFFKKQTIIDVGNYDEKNTLVEDYPMWLKLTKSGVKLSYFNEPTVGYRIYKDLNDDTSIPEIFKPSLIAGYDTRKKFAHPDLIKIRIYNEAWNYRISKFFVENGMNKSVSFYPFLYRAMTVYLNPFFYMDAVYRRIFHSLIKKTHN
ncbi:hypothetical protein P872_01600 [Rhodonellum psychrophilum GCM71 = DSM 17998]|uniref:Glycosyltransferase 2-like domain-containing protein n=2 Tax=Rhodonellum TaxID=336827 RepID=U5C1P4_9BACT|nr:MULTISPECIES: glycosyltransferase family A protein [Rhodonellum]ERM83983.1 hypothetical protein P872_01600 [Rhodonellum psychrophilum GCM71 = DSM 17998]SDZ06002.1 Glycosyl transferase family 2 [Rhodonellum ikkaensis]